MRKNLAISLLSSLQLTNADSAWRSHIDPKRHPNNKQLWTDPGMLTHDICTRAIDRLYYHNDDFNEVLEANTGNWTDPNFTFPEAIFWDDMRVTHP